MTELDELKEMRRDIQEQIKSLHRMKHDVQESAAALRVAGVYQRRDDGDLALMILDIQRTSNGLIVFVN